MMGPEKEMVASNQKLNSDRTKRSVGEIGDEMKGMEAMGPCDCLGLIITLYIDTRFPYRLKLFSLIN